MATTSPLSRSRRLSRAALVAAATAALVVPAAGDATADSPDTPLATSAAGSSGTAPSSDRAAGVRVRVATYNIEFGKRGLDGVAADIAAMRADVVVLQEVDDRRPSGGVNQAKYLADRLGMDWRYDPNSTKAAGKRGNAVLSTTPITDRVRVDLPNPGGKEARGLMRVTVTPGGVPMHVWVTHLNPGKGKLAQARKVSRVVGRPTCATVLGGDLNARPGSKEQRAATKRLSDLFAKVGRGAGATGSKGGRIDYLLTAKVSGVAAKVRPQGSSDHRAVVGTVKVQPRKAC